MGSRIDTNMLLCHIHPMRTTIEIPDPAFREMKALSAQRGMSMKEFVLRAVQEQVSRVRQDNKRRYSVKLPLIKSKNPVRIPSLTNAEIEDLLD